MSPASDLRTQAERVFHEWLDLTRKGGGASRDELLDECASPELRHELERLLDDYERLRSELSESNTRFEADRRVGEFRLVKELGRGGMGVVWEAEQVSIRRRVALKLLFPHHGLSDKSLERFRREAEAGGRLAHQGIVQVYSVGDADGVHYMAQELVGGGYTLADSLGDLREDPELPDGYYRKAAELFVKVADALAHAHEHGVIHRDIKPSNILIAENDQPKVADFGMAQVEDQLSLSRTGEFMGTPFYMSPEQAASKRMGLDHRTDVFSLGASLYEALTLVRPFDGDTSQQVFQKILTEDPPDPRTKRSRVPRELAVIAQKAMEKNPEKRFAAMADFGEDLRRFLRDEPIRAKPPSWPRRVQKWAVRHPTWSAVAGLGAAAIVVISVLLANYVRASRTVREQYQQLEDSVEAVSEARDEAVASALLAEERAEELQVARDTALKNAQLAEQRREESVWQREYLDNVRTAVYHFERGNTAEVHARLAGCPADARGWEWRHLSLANEPSLLILKSSSDGESRDGLADLADVSKIVATADGRRIVTRSGQLVTRVWDGETGAELAQVRIGRIDDLAFREGRLIAASTEKQAIRVWDPIDDSTLAVLEGHTAWVDDVALSEDGERLVSGGMDETVRVWDTRTGAELQVLTGHTRKVISVAIDRHGRRVASGSTDETARVWDVESGAELARFEGHAKRVSAVLLAPDGRSLVTESLDGTVRVWKIGQRAPLLPPFEGHDLRSYPVAFSEDGSLFASAIPAGAIGVWETRTGREVARLETKGYVAHALAIQPGGRMLAAGAGDLAVHLWHLPTATEIAALRGHEGPVRSVQFLDGGRRIVSGAGDGTARVWDANTGTAFTTLRKGGDPRLVTAAPICPVAVAPDGSWVASGEREQAAWSQIGKGIRVWDARTGDLLLQLRGHEEQVTSLVAFPVGGLLVSGSLDGTVRVWDLSPDRSSSGRPKETFEGHAKAVRSVAVTDDGARIVSGSLDGTVRVWGLRDPLDSREFDLGADVMAVAIDPTGERIFVGTDAETDRVIGPDGRGGEAREHEGEVLVLDARSGERIARLQPHDAAVTSLALSPDGRWLASGGEDERILVHDLEGGAPALSLLPHRSRSGGMRAPGRFFVVWSPDGRRLASGSGDGAIRIWEPRRGEELVMLAGPDSDFRRLWDPQTGIAAGQALSSHCSAVAFTPDGQRIVSAEEDGSVRIWESDIEQARVLWNAVATRRHAEALVDLLLEQGSSYAEIAAFVDGEPGLDAALRAAAKRAAKRRQVVETEEAVVPMVRQLFMRKPAADGVIADLERDSSLTPEEREAAVALARWLGDDVLGLYYDSRKIVRAADAAPEVYAEALDWARRATEAKPESSAYRSNLGLALYRAGELEAALVALELAHSTNGKSVEPGAEPGADVGAESTRLDHPRAQDLVFLSMTLWKLGRRDEARARLAQARAERDPEDKATATLIAGWLDEAERLISPQE